MEGHLMKRVLFVCMGNICRSPTGEGIFKKHLQTRGASEGVDVDSAGTIGFHAGKPADPNMRAAAASKGYELTSISRQVTADDFNEFDWIIAMDRDNLADLRSIQNSVSGDGLAHLCLLSDFLDDDWPTDVPDPYGGGESGFHYVVEMIESACPKMHDEILSND